MNPLALQLIETREHFLSGVINLVIGNPSNALEWDEARFEIHGNDGTVLDGAVHVVDVDVITEDLARIAVPFLERGTGKRQHGGIRQRITQVLCVTVSRGVAKTIVGTVCLVDDDHDVAPVREQRVLGLTQLTLAVQAKLLEGREVNTTRGLL